MKTAREVKKTSWFCQNITRECSSGAKHLFTMGKALGATTALRKKNKHKEKNEGRKLRRKEDVTRPQTLVGSQTLA